MSSQRFLDQLRFFQQALGRLEEALSLNETDIVRDSIVKRFEFSFEMGWKALYHYLDLRDERPASKKAVDTIPAAFENALITDVDTWNGMRQRRNDTSHEYDADKALELVGFVRSQAFSVLMELKGLLESRAEGLR